MGKYNDIIVEYERQDNTFNFLEFEKALEADIQNSTPDNDKTKIQRFTEFLKKLFDELESFIMRKVTGLKNTFKRIQMTDSGFEKTLRNAEVSYKPRNVELIMYDYNINFLQSQVDTINKVMSVFLMDNTPLESIDTQKDKLVAGKDELEKFIMDRMGAGEKALNEYFLYAATNFRGKKVKKVIMVSNIKYYREGYRKYDIIKNAINTNQSLILEKVKSLRLHYTKMTSNPSVPDDLKQLAQKRSKGLAQLYNIYSVINETLFNLRVEELNNCRIVLKRMYDI